MPVTTLFFGIIFCVMVSDSCDLKQGVSRVSFETHCLKLEKNILKLFPYRDPARVRNGKEGIALSKCYLVRFSEEAMV